MKTINNFKSGITLADSLQHVAIRLLKANFHTNKVRISSLEEDLKDGMDFIIEDTTKVAWRLRTYEYYEKFKHEFTIRSETTKNVTEFDKLRNVDYFLYTFLNEQETDFIYWKLYDIDRFFIEYDFLMTIHKGTTINIFKELNNKVGNAQPSAFRIFSDKKFKNALIKEGTNEHN